VDEKWKDVNLFSDDIPMEEKPIAKVLIMGDGIKVMEEAKGIG
jgi:hypothetical protein